MVQIADTLRQIAHSESTTLAHGVTRHVQWQVRRILKQFPCELTIANSKLHIDRPTGVAALINAMGEYDYNNMSLLKILLSKRPATFLDVGANIGSYTLIASEIPHARVISIEPHPEAFAALVRNVRLNDRKNVKCVNVAASSRDGELRLTDFLDRALNHVVECDSAVVAPLCVRSRQVDSICTEMNIIPEFVKIDVEGHEMQVLQGFTRVSQGGKVYFIEGGERPEVITWMSGAGYSGPWFVHVKRRHFSTKSQARAEDVAFVHKSFIPELGVLGFGFEDRTI
jgi:FkbM family methyltransferase